MKYSNFPTDSKEIINNSIQNYVLKLFKKRKNKESNVNQTIKSVDKPKENNLVLNEKNIENVQFTSPSGKFLLFIQIIK